MKVLAVVKPTGEQLPIISNPGAGVTLIRGAAGSGKTTTALLMLKLMAAFWQNRNERLGVAPARILVLTFNRTLRGYIQELAQHQIAGISANITVSTFGKWAQDALHVEVMPADARDARIAELGQPLGLDRDFLVSEVDYVLGRFLPSDLANYLSCKRVGRGLMPRMESATRERLLREVVEPFCAEKRKNKTLDWWDVAVRMISDTSIKKYNVIIVDEAQDFSANQIRAVMAHTATPSSQIFVLDAVQRIYPQGCTWKNAALK